MHPTHEHSQGAVFTGVVGGSFTAKGTSVNFEVTSIRCQGFPDFIDPTTTPIRLGEIKSRPYTLK